MQQLPPDTGVILVDHGSRRAQANEMLEAIGQRYQEHTGAAIVEVAHMELAEPTIAQAYAKCVARGAKRVVISLFFLSPGRHSTSDIPALAREASEAHPGVPCLVTQPLGVDSRLADLMHARVLEALETGTDRA